MADVERLLGRAPDVLVPSNRAIPTAITEGRTIVDVAPSSAAGRAFTSLAQRYLAAGGVARPRVQAPAEGGSRRRLALIRKGAA